MGEFTRFGYFVLAIMQVVLAFLWFSDGYVDVGFIWLGNGIVGFFIAIFYASDLYQDSPDNSKKNFVRLMMAFFWAGGGIGYLLAGARGFLIGLVVGVTLGQLVGLVYFLFFD